MGRLASFKDSENRLTVERLRCTCLLRFSPCYKIVAALNRMFGRCTTDSVTELKQRCDSVRLLFLITDKGFAFGRSLYHKTLIEKLNFKYMENVNLKNETPADAKPVLSAVVFPQILEKWDTAIVDLNRNNGTFKFDNVRLRNCSLHFSETTGEYYVRYREVTFGSFDVYNCR